jgi:tRNA(Ile2)-agmatinylcytidine synthase
VQLHIGIDDTDSTIGGCTTYIAARLVETISRMGIRFLDYPNIIRLNPNIPYKTRGNAAVALRVSLAKEGCGSVQEAVLREIEQNSHLGRPGTDPAVVFLKTRLSNRVRQFSRRALWDVLQDDDAVRIIRDSGASAAAYGSRLGLVGALAAVGQTLDHDHTYELVAYRTRSNCGTPRQVDEDSVKRMDRSTSPRTFNNYDYENHRILITPHGPDPVLLGIRGEDPKIVRKAYSLVRIREPVERWVIFRTNHGTDAHLQNAPARNSIEPNRPVVLEGTVSDRPRRISGGHVFLTLRHRTRKFNCAAFEPTGRFREVVAALLPGDRVTVYGGVKKREPDPLLTINLEKIRIKQLAGEFVLKNPLCPKCHKRMKSAGRSQGFRCDRCSATLRNSRKMIVEEQRSVKTGVYLPALKAHRHLTKPFSRYGHEKIWGGSPPFGEWHDP